MGSEKSEAEIAIEAKIEDLKRARNDMRERLNSVQSMLDGLCVALDLVVQVRRAKEQQEGE